MSAPQYDAFISYRHKELDIAVAKAIHRQLETYRIPRDIQKSLGRKRMGKVFRDQDELPLLADLGAGIKQALTNSEWLIVICTPELPLSKWCMAEIDYFISLGRHDRILTVLAAGEPEESFPEQLRYTYINGVRTEQEPLAADVRGNRLSDSLKKVKKEKLRLLAPILGVGYDNLRRRQRERYLRMVASVSVAVAVVFAGASAYVLQQNRLLDEQQQIAQQQRDAALISQSRFLAELSAGQLAKGDWAVSALLALEALPEDLNDPNRPLVAEAVTALRNTEITVSNAGYQPVFTVEATKGVHAFSSFLRQTRSYQLYENKLFTVADSAIYAWDIGTGEQLGEVALNPLKGRPSAVVFAPVSACAYLIYEDHFQQVYLSQGIFAEDMPLAYDGYFSPRGGAAWTGGFLIYGFANTAEYWSNRSGAFPDKLKANLEAESPYTCVSLSQKSSTYSYLLATGHEADREKTIATVRIWDISEGIFLRSLPIQEEISFLELSTNRVALSVVTKAGEVSLWNPATAQLLHELGDEDHVKQDHFQALEARFSPDSQTLAVCYSNGIIRLYDVVTGRTLRDLGNGNVVHKNVSWSVDGTTLVSAADDQNAYLYNADTGELSARLESFGNLLEAVFLDHDNILLEHTDGSLHIFAWRETRQDSGALAMSGEAVIFESLLSEDGKMAVSSTYNGVLCVYDTVDGRLLRREEYPKTTTSSTNQIRNMSWLKDGSGRLLIQGVHESALWNPVTGEWLMAATPTQTGDYVSEIKHASGNADGTMIIYNGQADWLHLHDPESGEEKVLFRHNPDSPEGLNYAWPLWSPTDPDRFLTYRTGQDDPQNLVNVWNRSGEKQFSINIGGDPVKEALWSPDGRHILCADGAGCLRVYEAEDGLLVTELEERPYSPLYCTWSPDGERIAFYADAASAWIWSWQSGGVVRIRDQEKNPQTNLSRGSWSPDGLLIYLYSEIYDGVTGTEVMALPDDSNLTIPVSWTPDSDGVLLKKNRYTLRLWSIRPVEELAAAIRHRLDGRVLTADERRRFFLE